MFAGVLRGEAQRAYLGRGPPLPFLPRTAVLSFANPRVPPRSPDNEDECPWPATRCTWLALNPVCCSAPVF